MRFNIVAEGNTFIFELDQHGLVWQVEQNEFLGEVKTGFGHEPTNNQEVAEDIAKQILYGRGIIKNI